MHKTQLGEASLICYGGWSYFFLVPGRRHMVRTQSWLVTIPDFCLKSLAKEKKENKSLYFFF